jgi:hypothetical protein
MATGAELINLGSCDAASLKGTNTSKGCGDVLVAAQSIWLFSPSAYIDLSVELNDAYIKGLQAQGKLVILKGVNTFEENGSDDTYESLDDDTQILTNEGKYKFTATFIDSLAFNAALHSLKGFGNWKIGIVDKSGNLLMGSTNSAGDKVYGFTAGAVQPTKLVFGTNTTGMKQGLMFQLLDRSEVDSNYSFFFAANLVNSGLNARSLEGVNDVILSYTTVPADSNTTISVKATLIDRKTPVSGYDYTDFLRVSDSSTSNPTAGDDTAAEGTYVLTVASISTGDVETIQLYDNGNNRSIVQDADGNLHKSNTATATATA